MMSLNKWSISMKFMNRIFLTLILSLSVCSSSFTMERAPEENQQQKHTEEERPIKNQKVEETTEQEQNNKILPQEIWLKIFTCCSFENPKDFFKLTYVCKDFFKLTYVCKNWYRAILGEDGKISEDTAKKLFTSLPEKTLQQIVETYDIQKVLFYIWASKKCGESFDSIKRYRSMDKIMDQTWEK